MFMYTYYIYICFVYVLCFRQQLLRILGVHKNRLSFEETVFLFKSVVHMHSIKTVEKQHVTACVYTHVTDRLNKRYCSFE